jgi:hypothetical protein
MRSEEAIPGIIDDLCAGTLDPASLESRDVFDSGSRHRHGDDRGAEPTRLPDCFDGELPLTD